MTVYRPPRPGWLYGAGAIAAVVLAALGGFVIGNMMRAGPEPVGEATTAPTGTASPSALATASANASGSGITASPSAGSPSPVAIPTDVLPPGSATRVLVLSLRLRENPSTAAGIVDTLADGELLVVGYASRATSWGPIRADGFDWYPAYGLGVSELPPLPAAAPDPGSPLGWIASGSGAEPYVEPLDPRCPASQPDLAAVEAMLPWERLACFGRRPVTLEGVYGCGACGGSVPGTFEPGWLAYPPEFGLLSTDPGQRRGPMALHFAPQAPAEPQEGAAIRVTGHFDDPAATGCVVAPGNPPVSVHPSSAELYCRERFVVESIELLG